MLQFISQPLISAPFRPQPLPLAWAPFFPFDATWRVRDGPHAVPMRGGPGAWPRDHLMLDWGGTLSKQIQSGVPTLVAEFTFQTLGRVGPNLDFSGDTLSARETSNQEQASFEPSNAHLEDRRTAVTSDEVRVPPGTSASDRPRDNFSENRSEAATAQQGPSQAREVALSRPTSAAAPRPLNPERSTRNSSYTSTTQYAPEPLEPPRVRATSPEVLAERAARAAAEGRRGYDPNSPRIDILEATILPENLCVVSTPSCLFRGSEKLLRFLVHSSDLKTREMENPRHSSSCTQRRLGAPLVYCTETDNG